MYFRISRARQAGLTVPVALLVLGAAAPAALLPAHTPVRLMVLNEVTSRSARPGDRFVILVETPVIAANGRTVIPAGTRGHGIVTAATPSAGGGRSGSLATRLVALDLAGRSVPLTGETATAGAVGEADAPAMTSPLTAPLAAYVRGNNGVLKAGAIIEGALAEDLK